MRLRVVLGVVSGLIGLFLVISLIMLLITGGGPLHTIVSTTSSVAELAGVERSAPVSESWNAEFTEYCADIPEKYPTAMDYYLCLYSPPDEPILHGNSRVLTIDDGDMGIDYDCRGGGTTFSINTEGDMFANWEVQFGTGPGRALVSGVYNNASREGFFFSKRGNAIEIYADSQGCNQTNGRFEILQTECDGNPLRHGFAANFEMTCEYWPTPLYGHVEFATSSPP
jgi:hypothetical protein